MITIKQAASFSQLKDTLRICYDSVSLSLTLLNHYKGSDRSPTLEKGYATFRIDMLRTCLTFAAAHLKALFWLFGMQDEL